MQEWCQDGWRRSIARCSLLSQAMADTPNASQYIPAAPVVVPALDKPRTEKGQNLVHACQGRKMRACTAMLSLGGFSIKAD